MALGASQRRVVSEMVRQASAPVLVGLIMVVAGTLGVARLMTTMLHEVTPYDPVVLSSVAIGLAAVALAAAYVPARRASGVDPLLALRGD